MAQNNMTTENAAGGWRPTSAVPLLIVGIFLLWNLFPIFWVLSTSFKPDFDTTSMPPKFFFSPTLEHYQYVLSRGDFVTYFRNSVIVAAGSTGLSLLVGTTAAYALARLQFRGRDGIFLLILASRMVPPIALAVPLFFLIKFLGLLGTHWAVILAHTTFSLPLVIWMMRSFFLEVPLEIEESAMIDGATRLQTVLLITLPLALPGLVATTLLCTINSWNEFMFALVLTGGTLRTLPVGISAFVGDVVVFYGRVMAAAALIMLPMLVLGFIIQRHFVRGITMGALK